MAEFDIHTLDSHIANLQSQLAFLTSALDDTSSEDPEWLATDLISLKGKSSMLVDDMRRVRKRMVGEGVRVIGKEGDGDGYADGVNGRRSKKRARLSIEGPAESVNGGQSGGLGGKKNGRVVSGAEAQNLKGPFRRTTNGDTEGIDGSSNPVDTDVPSANPDTDTATGANANADAGEYRVQYVDVTEEVNRRLRESRLRQLMDSPSTAKKRKLDTYETPENDDGDADASDWSEKYKSPTKKIRSSGQFEQMVKLNEGVKRGEGREDEGRGSFKRRRI